MITSLGNKQPSLKAGDITLLVWKTTTAVVNLKSKETVEQHVCAHGSGTVAGQFEDLY